MGYNVLIVDDMIINRKLMKSVLKNNIDGITFYDAEDGDGALDIIFNTNIDLVILDLMLPGKNGYEVLRELKSHPEYQEIPVIVNSAIDDMESFQRTFQLGAMDYFTKPLTVEEMKVILPLKVKNSLKYHEQRKLLLQMNQQMQNELKIASMFQSSLIPDFKQFDCVDMYGKYIPCKHIGGDFYDCIQFGDSLWFIIADVTGHGVASAMVSSMVKIMFNSCIQRLSTPSEVLRDINQTFCTIADENNNILLSAFVGVIRNGVLHYSNAGHPYPILLDLRNGTSKLLEQNGYLIGIFNDIDYHTRQIGLKEENALLLYTDGLFDIGMSEDPNHWDKVFNHTKEYLSLAKDAPKDFLNALMNSFYSVPNNDSKDDITIMLLKSKNCTPNILSSDANNIKDDKL